MSTIQHGLIRSTLGTLVWALRGSEYNIPVMRRVADMGSFVFFMPSGVETEKVMVDHIDCEWIIPKKANHNKVFLYLHGGGYALGSKITHRALAAEIVRQAGFCALIPEYRLAPEFPFPCALNDAVRCYEWLLETGHDPKDIIVGGDSAGGGLALACLLKAKEMGLPMPAAQVLISPWVDLTVSKPSIYKYMDKTPMFYLREMKTWARNYADEEALDHLLVSPLYADLTGLPPMLLQMSDTEVLVDEDLELAERAKAAGIDVTLQVSEGLMHVWHIYWRYLDQAKEAITKIVAFVGEQAGK
ncbi:MAG: alpha/beta hydrolase [Bacteroidetes bacterium]|nr:alpha/beta hydrolase [Bacteroidota bacterium]